MLIILNGLKLKYEDFYEVVYLLEVLIVVVELSVCYI